MFHLETSLHPRRSSLRSVLVAAFAAALASTSASAQQTLVDGSASYSFNGQSMWGTGNAFQFDYSKFVGIDSDPAAFAIGSGDGDKISVRTFAGTYSLDPYFLFDTRFKMGVELGASINSGSVDGNLDYAVNFSAPDDIQVGQAFSLTGSATALGSSGFVTRAPTAEAYMDGILEARVDGYARFDYVAPGIIKDHDYRWGNRGFTDNNTSNGPYANIANIDVREEIIGINRNQSGVVRYFAPDGDPFDGDLVYDMVGKGSSIDKGPVSLTAGNIDVVANGALAGSSVVGAGQDTLASVNLDIDHMLLGAPLLGQSLGHDFEIVDYNLSYDLADLDAGLDILLQQDFELNGNLIVDLTFSEAVMLEGIGLTKNFQGSLDQIPLITLLNSVVDVDAKLLVDAMLKNDTSLGFVGSLSSSLLSAGASLGYDIAGKTGTHSVSVGPVWDATQSIGLGDISVFDKTFSLGLAQVGSWSFALVPEPGTTLLLAAGLVGLVGFGGRARRRAC